MQNMEVIAPKMVQLYYIGWPLPPQLDVFINLSTHYPLPIEVSVTKQGHPNKPLTAANNWKLCAMYSVVISRDSGVAVSATRPRDFIRTGNC